MHFYKPHSTELELTHTFDMNGIALVFVACAFACVLARPAEEDTVRGLTKEEIAEAESAKYHYAADIQDGISDLTQQREEIRDGRKVTGFYSYSDGHYRRKVSYVADENGYRVTGEEITPLSGPKINPDGVAEIHTLAHGNEVLYSVRGDDKTRHKQNNVKTE